MYSVEAMVVSEYQELWNLCETSKEVAVCELSVEGTMFPHILKLIIVSIPAALHLFFIPGSDILIQIPDFG